MYAHYAISGPTTPQESELAPVRLAADTLSAVGKNPVKRAVVVSLPTIESAYVTHTAKALQGYSHPEYPAMRVAIEVLNATESYLWVRGGRLADTICCLTACCRGTFVVLGWLTALTVGWTSRPASLASRCTGYVTLPMSLWNQCLMCLCRARTA